MEYPMMANDESYEDTTFSRFVAEHEIAHTYMPFYMGINETRYGFMDEGWATTFEILIGRDDLGVEKAEETYKQFRVEGWINDPSPGEDVPIVGPGDNRIGQALGDNEYGKASLGYLAMKDLLGDELFKKCLHEYMNRWHGKHPLPWDFFFTFNDVAKKNLNWFWSNWFFSHNYIDLAIKSTTRSGNDYTVTIENIGGMAAPVNIIANYADGTKESFHQTPVIWQSNQQPSVANRVSPKALAVAQGLAMLATVKISSKKKVESISLDGGIFMDADTTNNTWKEKAF
jgi:aminopeptidase N